MLGGKDSNNAQRTHKGLPAGEAGAERPFCVGLKAHLTNALIPGMKHWTNGFPVAVTFPWGAKFIETHPVPRSWHVREQ